MIDPKLLPDQNKEAILKEFSLLMDGNKKLVIRPEHLKITQNRNSHDRLYFEAKLKNVHFVGSKKVIELVSGTQEIVVNLSDDEQINHLNEYVGLSVKKELVRIL
ncbi:TOBE domain-containing protein [Cytobacillus sp.]|uniref:TOBE domain-containing protein n=1 Tax=Cytobacillus sp. TaxID=2675269 RepID=UPI003512B3AC